MLRAGGQAVLIDTSPEFRLQALSADLSRLDAVFWTHGHADHLHGLDDLRALTWKKQLNGYASSETIDEIRTRFDYLWKETQRGGGKAKVILNTVEKDESVKVGQLEMIPIPVRHGNLRVFGWRCGPIAYITDASEIPRESYPLLEGLNILVPGALRFKSHPTHFVHRYPRSWHWVYSSSWCAAMMTRSIHSREAQVIPVETCRPFRYRPKSGRFQPEWPSAFIRNRWRVCAGIGGRFGADYSFLNIGLNRPFGSSQSYVLWT